MKTIRITIKAEPVAKARPRVSFRNGKIWTFTSRKTVEAQDFLRSRLSRHTKNAFPAHIPIKLTVTFYRTKSKWLPRKETMPFRKADLDNYTKTLTDSLTGILIPDDAQLTTIVARKRWASNGVGYITIKLESDKP